MYVSELLTQHSFLNDTSSSDGKGLVPKFL